MGPQPYPHRATLLATAFELPAELEGTRPYLARLISVLVFDQLVRHPILTLGDHDERLTDDAGQLLDAYHPHIEDTIDWSFRVARRHEVLWFELSLDAQRPAGALLRSRRPHGGLEEWRAHPGHPLSAQLGFCLASWLAARRLPAVPAFTEVFDGELCEAGSQLMQADALLGQGTRLGDLPVPLMEPPARIGMPFLRVLGELVREDASALDDAILRLDPRHPVARRNHHVAAVAAGTARPADVQALVTEAPMYARPHLSVWGAGFVDVHAHEPIGVRHQGIAASLAPASPFACHNYALQLAEVGRREESYRWADRATVAAPGFVAAHLDCVRRLRQVGRPGQAFAEAQYRCREILERTGGGTLAPTDWQAPHHAGLLIAFAHLDVGRLAEAIALGEDALAGLPDEPAAHEAFAWAHKRVLHWKTDPGLLARAAAWEGHHRGDPGRVIAGFTRGRPTDEYDAAMLIEALISTGRFGEAEIATWQCAGEGGAGILGDGKARLAAARTQILAGALDEALDHIQIVQLRRGQSRLEAELNRVLRLAATQPAAAWEQAIERRLARGAVTLAQLAARDLADVVPGLDTPVIRRALGACTPLVVEPVWFGELIGALPAVQPTADVILDALALPLEGTLAAADALAQDWWTVLVPPARDRDAHAAGAVLALGVALARYVELATDAPTPLAGAYRHIATEALHLVRRARYQLAPEAVQALLRLVDHLGAAPAWILDPWVLRIERALDLEAEHGAYLEAMIAGLPTVQRLLRGDERLGWELRLAHALASDPSQYEAAATLFARCARAIEGGSAALAWSTAAAQAGVPAAVQLDLDWLAALANPTGVAMPWIRLARGLLSTGRGGDGFGAACHGLAQATPSERPAALGELAGVWSRTGLGVALDGDAAFEAGVATAATDLARALPHLRWAVASDPASPRRAQNLAVALARCGRSLEAVRVLTHHERADAPRLIGRVLVDAGRDAEALPLLRYASRRFRTVDDWAHLALAAARADDAALTVEAGQHARALGCVDPTVMLALATALYRLGKFVECEGLARQLLAEVTARDLRAAALHAMARALAGQGRHVDAYPYAKAAAELGPIGTVGAELLDTMDRIVGQQPVPVRANPERSIERQACRDLEAGRFEALAPAIASPAWVIAWIALAATEFRTEDESGVPVSARALEAAVQLLGRTVGTLHPEATLARVRALRIRENAFIQIDPPPPLGARFTDDELAQALAERHRRPHRASAHDLPAR